MLRFIHFLKINSHKNTNFLQSGHEYFMLLALCMVIKSYNVDQQNGPLLNFRYCEKFNLILLVYIIHSMMPQTVA